MFNKAAALLAERGENGRKRAANASDYLLASLIVCEHCGAHYVGNAANGNRYRYRYYTCFSHHRYGKQECNSERLPADQLEAAILEDLLATYERSDLVAQALADVQDRTGEVQRQTEEAIGHVDADMKKTEDAIERYLTAFETGSMPETQCGPRVEKLAAKLAELRAHRDELTDSLLDATDAPPTEHEVAELREQLQDAITNGSTTRKKALVQALVHEVRVGGRDAIDPVYRIASPPPHDANADSAKVREPYSMAPPPGLEPGHPPPASDGCGAVEQRTQLSTTQTFQRAWTDP